jgi:fervidolysin-like protein
MLRLSGGLFLLVAALALFAHADRTQLRRPPAGVVDRTQEPKYRTDRVLVRFRPDATRAAMETAHHLVATRVLAEPAIVKHLQIVQLEQGVSVQEALLRYRQNPNVLYAEPDYIVRALTTPNDPQFAQSDKLRMPEPIDLRFILHLFMT